MDIIKFLIEEKSYKSERFGFVSPYQGQIQKLKEVLKGVGLDENVRTIDSWQGREVDYLIFSAVRCNKQGLVGFLENERRTNVALTRAKHGLIIIGNAKTLQNDPKMNFMVQTFLINERYCHDMV